MAMNIEPEKDHLEVEGMTERPFKSHDIQYSPLKIFGATVLILMVAGIVVGLMYWTYSRATGGG